MAITSQSQILNVESVKNAVAYLDEVINYLESAKSSLQYSLNYCGTEALNTNMGNTFPTKINAVIIDIDSQVLKLKGLKTNIVSSANSIHNGEYREYQNYLQRLADEQDSAGAGRR